MSFFSKLFSRKKKEVEQTPQPRYIILKDKDEEGNGFIPKSMDNVSYKILDTRENMKLGLVISHDRYNSWEIPHEEYPDSDKNGTDVTIDVTVGDFYSFPNDDNVKFRYYVNVLDKDIKRRANIDDADFALYTKLQEEIKTSKNPERAILLHTLLKVIDSKILTSPSRVTKDYRQQQEIKERAEKIAKEKALKREREIYRQEQLKRSEEQKRVTMQKQEKISNYMQKIKTDVFVK